MQTMTPIADVAIRVLNVSEQKLSLSASVPGESLCAGIALFYIEGNGALVCELVHVDKNYRLRGIASTLFDYAESHFARRGIAGLQLTPNCVEFFKARGMEIPSKAQIKSFHELFDAV